MRTRARQGPAALSGRVSVGDEIHGVNGRPVYGHPCGTYAPELVRAAAWAQREGGADTRQ